MLGVGAQQRRAWGRGLHRARILSARFKCDFSHQRILTQDARITTCFNRVIH